MVLDELLSWTIFEEGCCHALNIVLDELLPCTIFEGEVTFTRSLVTNAFIMHSQSYYTGLGKNMVPRLRESHLLSTSGRGARVHAT